MGKGPQGTPEGPRGTAAKDLAQISIQIPEKDFFSLGGFFDFLASVADSDEEVFAQEPFQLVPFLSDLESLD